MKSASIEQAAAARAGLTVVEGEPQHVLERIFIVYVFHGLGISATPLIAGQLLARFSRFAVLSTSEVGQSMTSWTMSRAQLSWRRGANQQSLS